MVADRGDINDRMARAQAAWSAGQHGAALELWTPLANVGVARAQATWRRPSSKGAAWHATSTRPPTG